MMTMSKDDSFAWELAKENVIPVSRGRNVDKLNDVLVKSHSLNRQADLEAKESDFIETIKSYTGNDPLHNWLEYYKWIQDNYPSDSSKILGVLTRATNEFKTIKKYRNDVRYMKLWVVFADKTDKPFEAFNFLYKNKIGDKLALFYVAWSLLYEKRGKNKEAEKIFNRGFSKKAEPQAVLKEKYNEFNRRVSQKWIDSSEVEGSDSASTWTSNVIEQPSARCTNRVASPFDNVTNLVRRTDQTPSLSIITENLPSGSKRGCPTPREPMSVTRSKSLSNTKTPGQATPRPISGTEQHSSAKPVAIFVDNTDERSTSTQRHTSTKRPHFHEEERETRRYKASSRDIFCFHHELLVDEDGNEQCFEEIRSLQYLNGSRNSKRNGSQLNQTISSNEIKFLGSSTENDSFQAMQAACNEDITINTKLAMEDINGMFQSPEKLSSNSKTTWIPRTEEPIIRKLQFSSFGEAEESDGDEFPVPTRGEENTFLAGRKKKESNEHQKKMTYKDILGYSFLQRNISQYTNSVVNPYKFPHRLDIIQSYHVIKSLQNGKNIFIHEIQFNKIKTLKKKIILTKNIQCIISHQLGSGTFGNVYAAFISCDKIKKELAMKIELGVQYLPWEYYIIQEAHRRHAQQDLPNDLMIISTESLHIFPDTTILFLQRGHYGTLHDLITAYAMCGKTIPEELVLFYTYQMLVSIHGLHHVNILHGDVKPDNWLLVENSMNKLNEIFFTGQLCLIDFGRAIDLNMYPFDIKFIGNIHAKDFQCKEMLQNKNWKFEIDTFSICSIIHLMLFGKYMEIIKINGIKQWKRNGEWKRYWHLDIWQEYFNTFLSNSSTKENNLIYWIQKFKNIINNKKEIKKLLRYQDNMMKTYMLKKWNTNI